MGPNGPCSRQDSQGSDGRNGTPRDKLDMAAATSIYDLHGTLLTGRTLPLADFRGQVLLVVNTASNCGFTPQYAGLDQLYRGYRPQGFSVLGFPSNDFWQEPLDDEQVHDFCLRSYSVTFPLFSKTHVNGPEQHPLFALLKQQAPGFRLSRAIKWNFSKFLIDRDGRVVSRHGPMTTPERLRTAIEALLAVPAQSRPAARSAGRC
jgi:glutathione peroxidase